MALPTAGQDWNWEQGSMPTSVATPGVSKDNFTKRGSDIYKEEEKK